MKEKNIDFLPVLSIPEELSKYVYIFDCEIIPCKSIPFDMIDKFIELRKEYKKECELFINEEIECYDYKQESGFKPRHHNLDFIFISFPLSKHVYFNSEKNEYIFLDNIPFYLKCFVKKKQSKFEKYRLKQVEDYLKNEIKINRFKNRKIKEFPDELFKYIRYENGNIIFLDNIPDELTDIANQYKLAYENEKEFCAIIKNKNWFTLPPENLYNYIQYNNYDISLKENVPTILVSVFEEYEKYFNKTKEKYLKLSEQYIKVL